MRGRGSNLHLNLNDIIWGFLQRLYGGGEEVRLTDDLFSDSDRFSEAKTNSTCTTSASKSIKSDSPATVYMAQSAPLSGLSKPMGLTNELYYCYLNSMTQCLLGLNCFTNALFSDIEATKTLKRGGKWTRAILEVIATQSRSHSYHNPRMIKKLAATIFDRDDQHDSHEFMRHLLSSMQDEINPSPSKKIMTFNDPDASWRHYKKFHFSCVDEAFAGQITSRVHCRSCGNVSMTFDPILDLSLPLTPKCKSIDDCISSFFKEEELPDTYKCEKCKRNSKALKKMRISQMPNILVLHLKRFKIYPRKKKINDYISFPVESLTLKKYLQSIISFNTDH